MMVRSCFRGKLAWIRVILVSWIILWGVFSFIVYPNLFPEQGDYFAQVPNTNQLEMSHTKDSFLAPSHRLDEIFLPMIQRSRTIQLSSLPNQHRIPLGVTNVTEYFTSSPNHVAPYREYFFDYNPSIVRIPKDQVPTAHASQAVYLASFRVSNLQYCFHPEDRQRMINYEKVTPKDWLGLALLDAEWNIQAETIVDVQPALRGAQDFRLFVLGGDHRDTTEPTTIYLNSNDVLLPLRLIVPSSNEEAATTWTKLVTVFEQQEQHQSLSTQQLQVWVAPKQTRCAPCAKPRSCGKNFHFFTASASPRQLWVEVWPSSPHLVRLLGDESPCRRNQEPQEAYVTQDSPEPSFANPEMSTRNGEEETTNNPPKRRAKAASWLTRGRGSACCIPIQHPESGQSLLLGIAHSKTLGKGGGMQPNHYLSSLYAFENQPPFALVAQSGYFCLPFPAEDVSSASDNPMVNITRWRILRLGERLEYPHCPRIHFVSGMALDAHDPDKVTVTYGLNDCFSRFVQVSLSDLTRLLFYGPP